MPNINGKFYPNTQEGVKKYQEDAFKDHNAMEKTTKDAEKKQVKGSRSRKR